MSATEIKTDALVLTSDPEQRAKLRRKLAEYEKRYGFPFTAPEVLPTATYRFYLLQELLEKEIVDVREFEKNYSVNAWHSSREFEEVVDIIRGYNSNDLRKIIGGGLT